jgi:hypothetical protein
MAAAADLTVAVLDLVLFTFPVLALLQVLCCPLSRPLLQHIGSLTDRCHR